ncbi:MAG: hypothetical protein ACI9JM_003440 [Halioglobus sp.]|jgi:hypothetical protein
MKVSFFTLLLMVLLSCPAAASPMLSPDGTTLSNVVVGTDLYDITFVDGPILDTYSLAQVSAPGWADLANSISAGVFNALTSMTDIPVDTDIHGCEVPLFFPGCYLFLPDDTHVFDNRDWFEDNTRITYFQGNWTMSPFSSISVTTAHDSSVPGVSPLTFITFELVGEIPAPASWLLLVLGLLGLAGSRRKKFI